MSEGRIPCVITGCRRTFKADAHGGGEVLCGKHYRCNAELHAAFKKAQQHFRKIARLLNRRWHAGTILEAVAESIWNRAEGRKNAAWDALKAEAQRLQDAGFFARRCPTGVPQVSDKKDRHADKFEDQFQRLKRAMKEGKL